MKPGSHTHKLCEGKATILVPKHQEPHAILHRLHFDLLLIQTKTIINEKKIITSQFVKTTFAGKYIMCVLTQREVSSHASSPQ
jgi:hypothetical protein